MIRYELGSTAKLSYVFRDADGVLTNPTTVAVTVHRPDGTEAAIVTINNPSTGLYNCLYPTAVVGEHVHTATGSSPSIDFVDVKSGFFIVVDYGATDIDTLIPTLREYLGDWEEPYRYTTTVLRSALVFSVKILMRRWRSKYKIEDGVTITRNPNYTFEFAAPPTIQEYDEPAIVLQAAVIIKSGSLQEATWQTASWRDDEIQVSNIQGQRSREKGLQADIDWLDDYFKRRLYAGSRQSLGGFKYPMNWAEG